MSAILHAHSEYSLGYGTAAVDELAARAAAAGYEAVALTDIENLSQPLIPAEPHNHRRRYTSATSSR